jgi:mRNA interferase MazF
MIAFEIGDIVSVEFPFTDHQGRKRRPGLVLNVDSHDAVLARLTTRAPRDAMDVALSLWSESGLPRPSTIRLTKLTTVDRQLIHHRIGRLRGPDIEALLNAMETWRASVSAALEK